MRICLLGPASVSAVAGYLSGDHNFASPDTVNYGSPVSELARSLIDLGHEVSIVTHQRGRPALSVHGPLLHFYRVSSERSRRQQVCTQWGRERRLMTAIVNDSDVEVVHAHWSYEWALAGLKSNKPLIVTIHDSPVTILRHHKDAYRVIRLFMACRVRFARRDLRFTAVSEYIAAKWSVEMFYRRNITVIANVVKIDQKQEEKYEKPTIIDISDSGPRKNVKQLLKAFEIVRRSLPDAVLLLVGPGLQEDDNLNQYAVSAGLADGVVFLGEVERPRALDMLSRSWLHTHLSLEESFGMTLVESMATGTSVLAGKHSGASDWILDDGGAGRLVDLNSTDGISSAIVEVLMSSSIREDLSSKGLRRYKQLFEAGAVAESYVRFYLEK